MNTAIDVVKLAGGLVVGTGVTAVVTNLIKVTTPRDIGKLTKACIWVGGIFVSWVASEAASNQLDNKVDKVVKYTKIVVDKLNPKKEVLKTEEEVCEPANPVTE